MAVRTFLKLRARQAHSTIVADPTAPRRAASRALPMLDVALYGLGAVLIAGGLAGAVLPALPGIPMIFGGIWLVAAVDHYRHLGLWWLLLLGAMGAAGVITDFVASALGARRVGASRRALWGATAGTAIGMFFGIPGLVFGPFVGALAGELASGTSVLRSAHVGIGTWVGLLFGTLLKLVISLVMVGLFALALLIG
jgi:uncharacterized protein YqgC (DUF456 family)